MDGASTGYFSRIYLFLFNFLRKVLWSILSLGPIPQHVAIIMDGNRRFARFRKLEKNSGHRFGFLSLISTLRSCYEMGIKYVTVYAFSIDNFKRKPDEVGGVMDLMYEKLEEVLKEETVINTLGVKVLFIGNLKLLPPHVRDAAEKVMKETAHNSRAILSVCMSYTSTDEIAHAVDEICIEKNCRAGKDVGVNGEIGIDGDNRDKHLVTVADLERHMYMAHCPEPDILIRTSGETRLSNFLLWQTSFCYLHATKVLWPAFSFRHLLWAILEYQKVHPYLEKMKKRV